MFQPAFHRDASYRLRDEIRQPQLDHTAAIEANKLAYTGLTGGFDTKLNLADYVDRSQLQNLPPALAPQPLPVGFKFGMLLNDKLGDCVPAEMIHSVELFHIAAGTTVPPFADIDAQNLYSLVGGYVPGKPNTDQGTDPTKAWNLWKTHGIHCKANNSVHKIQDLVGFDPSDVNLRHLAIYEFDAAQYAIALPAAWQGQPKWSGVPIEGEQNTVPGSWGGHGICARAYDSTGAEDIVTWGEDLVAEGDSLSAYLQQAAVVVSNEMLSKTGVSRCGLSWGDLLSDVQKVVSEAGSEVDPAQTPSVFQRLEHDAEAVINDIREVI